MKKLIIISFLLISTTLLFGGTYYVSTTGSDSDPGTFAEPWATWQYGVNHITAGDILYIRGGTYTPTETYSGGRYVGARMVGRTGTSGSHIQVLNYPDEVPVLDCSNVTHGGAKAGLAVDYCHYVDFKGLTIIYCNENSTPDDGPADGFVITDSDNINIEKCIVTRCGNGFVVGSNCDFIDFTNCDAFENADLQYGAVSSSGIGGYCDGFGVHNSQIGAHASLTGCRAWNNSDDGYDFRSSNGYIHIVNCWAFENGHTSGEWEEAEGITGDGDGFKIGSAAGAKESGIQRSFENCVVFNNDYAGFDEATVSETDIDMSVYNCISFNNPYREFSFWRIANQGTATLVNNIAYPNNNSFRESVVQTTNSWQDGLTITDADFISVTPTGVDAARNSDGSLDVVEFLHLAEGSDCINAGTDVDLTYDCDGEFWDDPPSIGAFEYQEDIGTSYYVKTGGNDSNTGLSDAQAWAHHPWMYNWTGSVTLVPGDIVYMNKGDTWNFTGGAIAFMTVAQSGTAENYITTTSYGSGAKPLLKINVAYTSSSQDIISMTGRSFIKFDNLDLEGYSGDFKTYPYTADAIYLNGTTTPCHDIEITGCEIHDIPYCGVRGFINCYNITIGDVTATATATTVAYSNQISYFGYAGVLLGGCNPANDRSDWNVYYNYIHHGTRVYEGTEVNEYGISFTYYGSSHAPPSYCYARYNRVEYIRTWSAVGNHGGSYHYFTDNYVHGFGRTGIALAGDPGVPSDHFYIERNIVEQTAGSYDVGMQNSFICISNASTDIPSTYVYIRDNTVFWTARPTSTVFKGIKIGNCNHVEVTGNIVYNGPSSSSNQPAIHLKYDGPGANSDIEVSRNFVKQWGPSISLEGNSIQGSVIITNNIVTKPGIDACFEITAANLTSSADVELYNNTFIQDSYSYVFYTAYGIAAGGSFIAKNNILGRTSAGSLTYWRWGGTISGTFTCDYNIYWNTSTSLPFYISGSSRTWSAWKGLGYDTHSPNVTATLDPIFLNAGGSYNEDTDFELDESSPAIDAGTDTDLDEDYAEDTRPVNIIYDIGAYEYQEEVFTDYYISPSGNDISGDGSIGNPWRTLWWATTNVTTVGNIIHVASGTYYESTQMTLAVGVDILGTTPLPVINTEDITTDHALLLTSASEGTDGSQSISYLKFDGNNTGYGPLYIGARSNVEISYCEFIDYFSEGPQFGGRVRDNYGEPTIYATGNSFHHNIVTNCADYEGSGEGGNGNGNLGIGGQAGMLIYNNDITQLDRGVDANGYCIKFLDGGYYHGLKIYNNTIIKPVYDGSTWDFAIELWHTRGGIEIHNNTIQGGLDFAGGSDDSFGYGYAAKVYDNTLGFNIFPNVKENAIYLERTQTGGMYIYNNLIKNVSTIIQAAISDGETWEGIYFYNNIVNGLYRPASGVTNGIELSVVTPGDEATYDNINFVNNTIYCGTSYTAVSSILRIDINGTCTNLTMRNNILYGALYYPIYIQNSTIDIMSVENNLYYNNGGANVATYVGCTITNKTEQNNVIDNPDFVALGSNFYLQDVSSCIGAGIDIIWLDTDYAGNSYDSPPAIGAYEYLDEIPTVTTTAISNIAINTATGGGNVTSDGGGALSAVGVCWDTSTNPTIVDSHTDDGDAFGVFVSSLSGLIADTHYYVRAYATNQVGTAYGSNVEFDTLEEEELPPAYEEGNFLVSPSGKILVTSDGKFLKK